MDEENEQIKEETVQICIHYVIEYYLDMRMSKVCKCYVQKISKFGIKFKIRLT
jgi:hypothetical protein